MNKGLFIVASLLVLALVMGCGEKMTEEQLYAQALDFQSKQQWDDVVKTYEKLIKMYPESPKADEHLYNLGMVYANNVKAYDKAIKTWKKLIEQYPQSTRVVNTKFMIGYCYANNVGDLDKARAAYQDFLEEYPNHELAPSVQWELDHLGQDISDIELQLGDEGEQSASK